MQEIRWYAPRSEEVNQKFRRQKSASVYACQCSRTELEIKPNYFCYLIVVAFNTSISDLLETESGINCWYMVGRSMNRLVGGGHVAPSNWGR